jgi:hypothetical protein
MASTFRNPADPVQIEGTFKTTSNGDAVIKTRPSQARRLKVGKKVQVRGDEQVVVVTKIGHEFSDKEGRKWIYVYYKELEPVSGGESESDAEGLAAGPGGRRTSSAQPGERQAPDEAIATTRYRVLGPAVDQTVPAGRSIDQLIEEVKVAFRGRLDGTANGNSMDLSLWDGDRLVAVIRGRQGKEPEVINLR